ncbi:uncharacterized protein LOC142543213 [Primulina tabacum]|uniref:uncharacterized protein LOC142543213 n=1 Tax=Primulina tabacum TaxID=48773 RepID=UPI003F5A8570
MAASALSMNLNLNGVAPPRFSPLSYALSAKIGTVHNHFIDPNLPFSSSASICIGSRTTHMSRPMPAGATGLFWVPDSSSLTFDVVVVGAGIIGLTIARHFLLHSNLSVALVDAAVPCAGATGAGQGYIWRVHKIPGSEKWELAIRGHQLWEALAVSIQSQGMDPLQELGWKKTGSLLVGRTAEDCSALRRKVEKLKDAGLGAEFLSSDDLQTEEPALDLGQECGAAFMPDDCQLDARRAVAFIEKGNRYYAAHGRYAEFYYEPVTSFLRSQSSGEIEAVQTSKNTLFSKKAVILATGCWTGSLIHEVLKNSEILMNFPVKPRRQGHLLVLENFKSLNLNHGLMEVGYGNHESATIRSAKSESEIGYDANTSSISMTATMDMSGRLVLGSSRQLVGFSTEVDESIIDRIWERAREFFPTLTKMSLRDMSKSREVRVGLRPYMPGGKPVLGPMPGLSNLFVAAGHEGEGLSLALGTAEMIVDMVLENPPKVNPEPFSASVLSSS